MEIRLINNYEARAIEKELEAEHLYLRTDVQYIGCFIDGKLIGLVGYTLKKPTWLLCDYVNPEHRFKGLYAAMNDFRLNHLREIGIKSAFINCRDSSVHLHLKNGAKFIRMFANGTRLKYENI